MYMQQLAAATAFDLGGPINKAAGFVALGLTTENVLPITARTIAIVVPPIGLGLTTLLDKRLVGRRVYDRQFYQAGKLLYSYHLWVYLKEQYHLHLRDQVLLYL